LLLLQLLVGIALSVLPAFAAAALQVVDDRGQRLELPVPARRIVTLAPHLTELMFAAGAGERIVGTVAWSDFPAAARSLPRVGDALALDLERIVALKPDLVVVWLGGSAQPQLDVLAAMGLPIYYNEPRSLDAIGDAIERFGELAGTAEIARPAAARYRARLQALRARQAGKPPVTVFHQLWDRPLMTTGGTSLISQVITLCGGRNVFAGLGALAPQVAFDAVLEFDPEVIGGAGLGDDLRAAGLGAWLAWPQLTAVRRGNLYVVPPELISQHVPRILEGAERVCAALDAARARRP
jgi:iron complex transport system substrate-binding protein